MKIGAGVLGGVVAGILGAAIWATVVHYTGYEWGIIAWGIGGLVGVGVMIGSARAGGPALGAVAAVLAVAAIVLGKWAWVHYATTSFRADDEFMISEVADLLVMDRQEAGEAIRLTFDPDQPLRAAYPPDIWSAATRQWESYSLEQRDRYRAAPNLLYPQRHLARIADDVCLELMDEGQAIDWAEPITFDTAWREAHYPAEIWAEAVRRWEAWSAQEQAQYMLWLEEEEIAYMATLDASVPSGALLSSFSLFDLLWGFLAVGTAFRIAAVGGEAEEKSSLGSA